MLARQTVALLAIIVLIMVFYPNRCFQLGVNPGEDLLEHDVPLARFFVGAIQQGSFPHWNPHKVYGLPAREISFMGPYYPMFLLFFVFPAEWAVNLGFVLHFGLSALFFFLLCRELGLSHFVAFFCASSWILSSLFQQYSESGWLSETVGAVYLPGAIWLIVKSRNAGPRSSLLLYMSAGACIALCLLGAHPANSLITVLSVVFFCIPCLRSGTEMRALALMLLVGLLLSIVTWGPLLIQYHTSNALPLERVGYLPKELLNYVSPEDIRRGFAGRILLLLGLVGCFLRRQPHAASFRVVFLISLVLCLVGSHRVFDSVPLVSGIRNSWQWHVGTILSLIVFAGYALSRLEILLTRYFRSRPSCGFVLFGLLAAQLLDLYGFNHRFYPHGFSCSLNEYYAQNDITHILDEDPSIFRIINRPLDSAAFRVNQGMLQGIDCIDSKVKGVSLWRDPPSRTLTYAMLSPNQRSLYDFLNVKYIIEEVEDPQQLHKWVEDGLRVRCTIEAGAPGEVRRFVLLENERCFPRAFLVSGPIDENIAPMVGDIRDDEPRKISQSSYRLGNYIFRPQLDYFGQTPILSSDFLDRLSRHEVVQITRVTNEYQIDYTSGEGGFLFLTEMYDPGWKASVDGTPAKILLPLGKFMGLYVPSGAHRVVFAYRPLPVYICWIVNILALVACVVIAVVVWRTRDISPDLRRKSSLTKE